MNSPLIQKKDLYKVKKETNKMKIMITFLSALIVFLGIIPFFGSFPIPNKGTGYSIVLIIFAVLVIAAALMNSLLMGLEKFFLLVEGVAVMIVAILPLLPGLLTFLPREGPLYAGIVIIVGAIGLIYGLLGMG